MRYCEIWQSWGNLRQSDRVAGLVFPGRERCMKFFIGAQSLAKQGFSRRCETIAHISVGFRASGTDFALF